MSHTSKYILFCALPPWFLFTNGNHSELCFLTTKLYQGCWCFLIYCSPFLLLSLSQHKLHNLTLLVYYDPILTDTQTIFDLLIYEPRLQWLILYILHTSNHIILLRETARSKGYTSIILIDFAKTVIYRGGTSLHSGGNINGEEDADVLSPTGENMVLTSRVLICISLISDMEQLY